MKIISTLRTNNSLNKPINNISALSQIKATTKTLNSNNNTDDSLIDDIKKVYQNIKNYFNDNRSSLGLGLAVAGLIGSITGVLLGGSLGLIIKILDAFATVFTAIDYTFFVPAEILESFHELNQMTKDFSFKSALNILLKLLPLFFVGKWFFGHKFSKQPNEIGNLQKVKEGKIPLIALAHIPRAHIKNLSGGITFLLSWYGRTELCKYISGHLISKISPLKSVNHSLFGRFQQSLLFFMLAVFPGWRPKDGEDDFIIK